MYEQSSEMICIVLFVISSCLATGHFVSETNLCLAKKKGQYRGWDSGSGNMQLNTQVMIR